MRQDLYGLLFKKFLGGTLIVGLGNACSLLGITRGNHGAPGSPLHAVLPLLLCRFASPEAGMQTLHRAIEGMLPHFSKNNPAPRNDLMGASFAKESCLVWDPKNQEVERLVGPRDPILRQHQAATEKYLSDLCLSVDEIGGQGLSPQWSDRVSLQAITGAASKAKERLRLREKREANLRLIKEEEYKAMGEVRHGERSNFDVFGCQRGKCESCDECKGYAQPLHMGLSSGPYAFLCANCGCSHSCHAEVVH